jgi:hypothetical protein
VVQCEHCTRRYSGIADVPAEIWRRGLRLI